jgi:glycosyltransferase involved in cell wall biosynthesis
MPRLRLRRRGEPCTAEAAHRGERVTMLLENLPYPQDPRVRREAESLVAAGHSVEVVAPRANGQPAQEVVNGVAVRRFPAVEMADGGIRTLLLEYVVAAIALHAAAVRALLGGATVLHIHNPPDILFPAGWLFRAAGRRVVFDHHDLGPELVEVKFGARKLVACAKLLERLTFAAASHVIATNQSHAMIASTRGGKAATAITIVRNGPPESWTRLPMHVRDGKLDRVRLAYVGAIASQDGVEGIAEVLAYLRDRTPPVPVLLTVIGDGDARPELEEALAQRGVADAVKIAGWVPAERVPELLQEVDVCVDPAPATTLNERSTMIKLAEYLALGKPTVAYDLRETRYTVGDAGILVPAGNTRAFGEAIANLAEDAALRRTLSSRARSRALELTWERAEPALLKAYASFNGGSVNGKPAR